jgi:hypothetical protein
MRDKSRHNYVDRDGTGDDGSVTADDDHGISPRESEQALKETFQPCSPGAPRCGQ